MSELHRNNRERRMHYGPLFITSFPISYGIANYLCVLLLLVFDNGIAQHLHASLEVLPKELTCNWVSDQLHTWLHIGTLVKGRDVVIEANALFGNLIREGLRALEQKHLMHSRTQHLDTRGLEKQSGECVISRSTEKKEKEKKKKKERKKEGEREREREKTVLPVRDA